MNYYSDESEWKWLFENAIDWETVLPLYYPKFPTEEGFTSTDEILEFFEELLGAAGDWTGNAVTQRASILDKEGAGEVKDGRTVPGEHLAQLIKEATELSVFGIPLPREFGGLETPVSIYMMVHGMVSRACISSAVQTAFFTSIGNMIGEFCDEETQKKYIPKICAGEISGAMCLTEPGCGSDLGLIRTSAKEQEDGKYLINGNKIFITNGGGGLHFTLARIEGAPQGLAGISIFFIEQEIEKNGESILNFRVAKNEEKMGMHGSFTCEVVYENSVGHLVGKSNEGFRYMLQLMNEARMAVGMEGLGGIESCVGYAKKYALERVQFGKPIAEQPLLKRILGDMETERDALRAFMFNTLSHFDIYFRLDKKKRKTDDLNEKERRLFNKAKMWVRKRTPLVKYYCAESFTAMSQKCMQVLGGYGYMCEYPLERIHRDSFGPLIYEGTSQIQALMALKDVIKFIIKDPKRFFSGILLKHPTEAIFSKRHDCEKKFRATQYRFKKKMLGLFIKCLTPRGGDIFKISNWKDEKKIDLLLPHAETLCQGLSYIETLRVLTEHAVIDEERIDLFQRYLNLVTPRFEYIYATWKII